MKMMIQFDTANGIRVLQQIEPENLDREHRRLLEERIRNDGSVCQLARPAPGQTIIASSPAIDALLVALERDQAELRNYHA